MPANLPEIVVIADDLTGAADAGAAFLRCSWRVSVELDAGYVLGAATGVTAIDTDTRRGSADAARVALEGVADRLDPRQVVLKKVDSLLRGHISAELDVLRRRLPTRPVLVAPAFPAAGRTTRDGVQQLDGVPLLSHAAAGGLGAGAPEHDRLSEVLAPHRTRHVSLERLRNEPASLGAFLDSCRAAGRVAVCDAESDDDLDRLVASAGGRLERYSWVGSAGLAAALARAGKRAADAPAPSRRRPARMLAIVGSTSAVAVRQARALVEQGGATRFAVEAERLAGLDDGSLDDIGRELALLLGSSDAVVQLDGASLLKPATARAFARVLEPSFALGVLLVLVGGATARAVLHHLGVRVLHVIAEPEPGVVLAEPSPGRADSMIVTKAGSIGDDETLVRVVRASRNA